MMADDLYTRAVWAIFQERGGGWIRPADIEARMEQMRQAPPPLPPLPRFAPVLPPLPVAAPRLPPLPLPPLPRIN